MGRKLADTVWLDLSSDEADLMTELTGQSVSIGLFTLVRSEADELIWETARTFDHETLAPDGVLNDRGRSIVRLVSKLSDDAGDRALRLRAQQGDGDAAFELGQKKHGGPLFSYPIDSIELFQQAYQTGLRQAGYELAQMNPRQTGLDRGERIDLLEELALDGDPSAALEILHMPGEPIGRERLLKILEAVKEGSAEATEWFERITAETA